MFSDELLSKIFADKEMRTIPIGCQSTAVRVIERILEEESERGVEDGLLSTAISTTATNVWQ